MGPHDDILARVAALTGPRGMADGGFNPSIGFRQNTAGEPTGRLEALLSWMRGYPASVAKHWSAPAEGWEAEMLASRRPGKIGEILGDKPPTRLEASMLSAFLGGIMAGPKVNTADLRKLATTQESRSLPFSVAEPEMRGYHSGQKDLVLRAFDPETSRVLGNVDYVEFQGKPSIDMINVAEDARRRGIATALLDRLRRDYPGKPLEWGWLTDDGAAFKKAYDARQPPPGLIKRNGGMVRAFA